MLCFSQSIVITKEVLGIVGIIRDNLGKRIREARLERGRTQQELANHLEVSRAVVSDWETAKSSPNLDRLDDIAAYLRKPVSFFFTEQSSLEGHVIESQAFSIEAYSKAIILLQELQLECRRQEAAFESLIRHFTATSGVLFFRLSDKEKTKVSSQGLALPIRRLIGESYSWSKRGGNSGNRIGNKSEEQHVESLLSQAFAHLDGLSQQIGAAQPSDALLQANDPLYQILNGFLNDPAKSGLGLVERCLSGAESGARELVDQNYRRVHVAILRLFLDCLDEAHRAMVVGETEPSFLLEVVTSKVRRELRDYLYAGQWDSAERPKLAKHIVEEVRQEIPDLGKESLDTLREYSGLLEEIIVNLETEIG
jgi:transcriptional regulator with XRE-family HTH domain